MSEITDFKIFYKGEEITNILYMTQTTRNNYKGDSIPCLKIQYIGKDEQGEDGKLLVKLFQVKDLTFKEKENLQQKLSEIQAEKEELQRELSKYKEKKDKLISNIEEYLANPHPSDNIFYDGLNAGIEELGKHILKLLEEVKDE